MSSTFLPELLSCRQCKLHCTRTQVVSGEGSWRARVLLIGEAPGQNEDATGRPFIGRSGGLLRATLAESGFPMWDIYITNVVRCRPPDNREPAPEELAACRGWTIRFLQTIKPKIVVTAGRYAMREMASILDIPTLQKISILSAAGQPYAAGKPKGVYMYPLTHPSYIQRAHEEEWFKIQTAGLFMLYKEVLSIHTRPKD